MPNIKSIRDGSVHLYGQNAAIDRVDRAVRRAFSGLLDTKGKPRLSMLLLGPSGVGKTETAKALAEALYGNRDKVARFNANECATEGGQFKAFGPPRGYLGSDKGGQLTQDVKKFHGHCVILIDEIEKGSQEIFDGLMTGLDEGYFEDASFGERISIENCVLVMTSNVLADRDLSELDDTELRTAISGARVTNTRNQSTTPFRPEFMGRIQEVICYDQLKPEDIASIVAHKYQRSIAVNIAVQTKLLMLDLSPIALGYITDQVTGSRFGVRHVDQVLSREIVDRVIDMGDALPTDRKCWYVWDYRDGELELINVHKQGIAFLREQRGEDHQTTNDYLLRLSKQLIARAREVQNATPRSVAAKTPQPVGGKPAEPSRYIVR